MNVVPSFCMFSGSSLLFWAENWVKIGSKMAPGEFCRSRLSRDGVIHADVSFAFFLPPGRVAHASASLVLFQSARSREPCDRVTSRWLSPQILVFLPFLLASFPISNSFMPYKV